MMSIAKKFDKKEKELQNDESTNYDMKDTGAS